MQPQKREVLHYIAGGRNYFREWLDGLNDTAGRAAIRRRLDRVEDGNFGDRRFVGAGVWELRIHYGPAIVLLLCGGDKRTQWRDILKAQELWGAHRGSR